MEDIIAALNHVKEKVMLKDPTVIDTINAAIKMCEKKAAVIEAMMNPIPSRADLLPAEGNGGTVINSEYMTVNIFVNDPPHL